MSFNNMQNKTFSRLHDKVCGMNLKRETKLNLNMCTDTVISLYRGRFYARYAKFSSLYLEYRYIEDRYIGVLSYTFYCNFCRGSLYRDSTVLGFVQKSQMNEL